MIKTVTESQSVTQIPWKPIPAINMGIDNHETDYSTALSILYASSYVNGNNILSVSRIGTET